MTPLLDHDEEEFEELLHWWVFDTEGAMQQANTCYKTRWVLPSLVFTHTTGSDFQLRIHKQRLQDKVRARQPLQHPLMTIV